MKGIGSVFGQPGHIALMPYITVGYPSIEATLRVVSLLASSGCDMVELGIPFSDPLADGATIQKSSFQALRNGVNTRLCLEVAEKLSHMVNIPLVFMTYFNPVFSYGVEKFCADCARCGISGLIIPDLLPEEGSELEAITQKQDLDLIYLLSPTSTEARIKLVARRSRGFIYLVSVAGVTGARDSLPPDRESFVARVRKIAKQPLCVGFGISSPEQARMVARIADGVIVGSRVIQQMETDESMSGAANYARELRLALDQPQ
jgi:tryptophan synthase alpha chain